MIKAAVITLAIMCATPTQADEGASFETRPGRSNNWAAYKRAYAQPDKPSFYFGLLLGHEWRLSQLEDAFGAGAFHMNVQSGISLDNWLFVMDFSLGVHERASFQDEFDDPTVRRYGMGAHLGYRWQFSVWSALQFSMGYNRIWFEEFFSDGFEENDVSAGRTETRYLGVVGDSLDMTLSVMWVMFNQRTRTNRGRMGWMTSLRVSPMWLNDRRARAPRDSIQGVNISLLFGFNVDVGYWDGYYPGM